MPWFMHEGDSSVIHFNKDADMRSVHAVLETVSESGSYWDKDVLMFKQDGGEVTLYLFISTKLLLHSSSGCFYLLWIFIIAVIHIFIYRNKNRA